MSRQRGEFVRENPLLRHRPREPHVAPSEPLERAEKLEQLLRVEVIQNFPRGPAYPLHEFGLSLGVHAQRRQRPSRVCQISRVELRHPLFTHGAHRRVQHALVFKSQQTKGAHDHGELLRGKAVVVIAQVGDERGGERVEEPLLLTPQL